MENHLIKKPSDCRILIVDDEKIICDVLKGALAPKYNVSVCNIGKDAFSLIDSVDFDIIVTDLKLPDISGLDILSYAKAKDEYTEIIVITGYASLDSATNAINMGVFSYLVKPLSITDFLIQIERAVASRLFHLKSFALMKQLDFMEPDVKGHIHEITALYFFIRKLMLSLEISEIMRITLEEINTRMDFPLSVISVNFLGYTELYAMTSTGEMSTERFSDIAKKNWEKLFPGFSADKLDKGEISPLIYKGRQGTLPDLDDLHSVNVPMIIADRSLGSLTVFRPKTRPTPDDQNQFLYVFTSIVSSVIEHGYVALQARHQAKTDSLTGVANHRLFHETLDREIARSNRRKDSFSLILIDIDNFKKINDTFGHQIGDAVIIDLTKRVKEIIRISDLFARYGGEEFGLILSDTDQKGAEILAQRLLTAISSKPFSFSNNQIYYTVSLGLVVYNGNAPVYKDALISAADKALYGSKRNGKNRVMIGTVNYEKEL
jgi:two-component system cell cycle response regulator